MTTERHTVTPDIPAFQYEADRHCPACAAERFPKTSTPEYADAYADWESAYWSPGESSADHAGNIEWDTEGNAVHPTYEIDACYRPECGGCQTPLNVEWTRTYEDGTPVSLYDDYVNDTNPMTGEFETMTCEEYEGWGGDLLTLRTNTNDPNLVILIDAYLTREDF